MRIKLKRSCKRFYSSLLKITHSKHHTKEWRKKQEWYNNGKRNECEIYQKDLIKSRPHPRKKRTFQTIHEHNIDKPHRAGNIKHAGCV